MESKFFSKNVIVDFYNELLRHYKNVILAAGICLVSGGAFYGFNVYRVHREAQAHKSFVSCMKYFDAPVESGQQQFQIDQVTFNSSEEKWKKVAEVFKKGYEDHKGSGLAPFFLIFASEALINQNEIVNARELLAAAVPLIKSEELKSLYSIKLALMKLDATSPESDRMQGFELLKQTAEDSKSVVNDYALFLLGDYFWHQKDFALAKNYWNQLVLTYGSDTKDPSPWSAQAREKLKLIEIV